MSGAPIELGGAQRGFSLVTAMFLLVVLAGLAVFAVRIGTLQGQGVTEGMRAAQAFQAARSGVDWAAYRALHGVCAPATLSLTEGGTQGFTVSVACSVSTHTEGTSTVHVWVFDVRAEAGVYGGPDYVSRRLQSKITDAS
ncbi:MAG TPA: pilus assembly protein MshP [Gammaproteobacteria bacterium]|nr:pilus assembly protein MshP [Gammaproteobacteria bacterium]